VPDLAAILPVAAIAAIMAWSLWFPLAAGQLSMGAPGIIAIGAYTAGYLASHGFGALPVSVLIGAAVGAVAGLPFAALALRLRGFGLAIVTLGVSESIRIAIGNVDLVGGPAGMAVPLADGVLATALVVCAVVALATVAIYRGRLGRMLDVLEVDELQANALAVPTTGLKVFVLCVAGAVGGAGGALQARYTGYLIPDSFGLDLLIQLFAFVVVGGLGSAWGAFFGAAFLTIALDVLAFADSARSILFGAILVVVMLVRRDGALKRSAVLRRLRLRRPLDRLAMGRAGRSAV
jgi:branched-chain amino acid transport system permease protein